MPGLAIIINSKPAAENLRDLRAMTASMRHESFYSSGEYHNEALNLYVGWSLLKDSYGDCMPIYSSDRNRLLFFYGEHHADAQANGSLLNSAKATEVMEIIEKRGDAFLESLNGWFHGMLVDLKENTLTLFNDRTGMQRLYHHRDKDGDLFASEAKALLVARKELRRLDPRGLGELFSCGCVLENRSLFQGITTVPPASRLKFKRGRALNPETYFKAATWENQEQLSETDFRSAISDLVPQVVRRYFRDFSKVGISLTGGFDTRLIMAYLKEIHETPPCYTFNGSRRECFDVKIARKVAAQCACPYQVVSLNSDFLSSFPALAEQTIYLSDGNLGAFNAYELYLNKLAREIRTVRLTGSFGSEVIRGARAFKATAPTGNLLTPELEGTVRQAIQTFASMSEGNDVSFSVFKQAPWYYANRLSVEQSQVTIRTPFLDNDLVGLMYRAPKMMARQNLTLDLIERGNPILRKLPTDTGNASRLRGWFMQALFKADYCYKSGMPQWLERVHSTLGVLQPEKLLIGIHRFAHPRVWIRKELATYIRNILLDPKTLSRPFFNKRTVEEMVENHIKGVRNYTDDIERILTCELTCRQFVD